MAVLVASLAGCAGAGVDHAGPGLAAPVYCYRTLADVTCRTIPDPGREGRLVGVYLRDPADPGWPDAWLPPSAFDRPSVSTGAPRHCVP